MAGSGEPSPGHILRSWRVEVAGMAAAHVARDINVSRSAIANWESGSRFPDADTLDALDALYGAGGALVGLIRALGTPEGLPPRQQWWHNFSAPAGPVWGWARPAPGARHVHLRWRWGPLGFETDLSDHPEGLIVTSPTSVASPPVEARIVPAGWVDFGRGAVSPQLGIPTVPSLSAVRLVDVTDAALHAMATRLRPALNLDGNWIGHVRRLLGARDDLVTSAFAGARPPIEVEHLGDGAGGPPAPAATPASTPGPSPAPGHWSGDRYRALRRARRLSRAEAAHQATGLMPSRPVSADQIDLLERGGSPRVEHLPARLDVAYGADGQTTCEVISDGTQADGTVQLAFPAWWRGPVWLSPAWDDGTGPHELVLSWPPWMKRVSVHSGAVLTTRKSPDETRPLRAAGGPGCRMRYGLGAHPGAVDINYRWRFSGESAVNEIFNRYYPAYMELFGKSPRELLDLVAELRSGAEHDGGTSPP